MIGSAVRMQFLGTSASAWLGHKPAPPARRFQAESSEREPQRQPAEWVDKFIHASKTC